MEKTTTMPLSGRRAQAARNDQRILEAARAVFTADPGAPIAAVAARAGVGISALYHRYRSKEELIQRLCLDGLRQYIAEAEAALADQGDPWVAFANFMRHCVEAGTSSLTLRLAGAFAASEELNRAGRKAHDVTQRLIDRTKAAGVLRDDIVVGDLSLLFEQLQSIQVGDPERAARLRQRFLALVLDALHHPSGAPLPGPPPNWNEISERYNR
jgi:AcrR family transcriptional regulator